MDETTVECKLSGGVFSGYVDKSAFWAITFVLCKKKKAKGSSPLAF